jgi:chorismate synthase
MWKEAEGAEPNLEASEGSGPAPPDIRALETAEDFRACADLQRLTWGAEFTDLVPAHLMKIAQRVGGVAAGAFNGSGVLLGFVFGMTGFRNGSLIHWSDMLAVRPESRGFGIGRLLKQYQRRQLLALGVPLIEWSFDPLVARNAHLNLVRLGAAVQDYVVDMYGESTSDLHAGLGTDRLIVSWPVAAGGEARPSPEDAGAAGSGNHDRESVPASVPAARGRHPQIRIAIPLNIHEVRAASPERAREWRESTRASFLAALRDGYRVRTFETDREIQQGCYILDRQETLEDGAGDTL